MSCSVSSAEKEQSRDLEMTWISWAGRRNQACTVRKHPQHTSLVQRLFLLTKMENCTSTQQNANVTVGLAYCNKIDISLSIIRSVI